MIKNPVSIQVESDTRDRLMREKIDHRDIFDNLDDVIQALLREDL